MADDRKSAFRDGFALGFDKGRMTKGRFTEKDITDNWKFREEPNGSGRVYIDAILRGGLPTVEELKDELKKKNKGRYKIVECENEEMGVYFCLQDRDDGYTHDAYSAKPIAFRTKAEARQWIKDGGMGWKLLPPKKTKTAKAGGR